MQNEEVKERLLCIPGSEHNLLGRDLIIKLGLEIGVHQEQLVITMATLTEDQERKINPEVWVAPGNRGGLRITPFEVTLKQEGETVCVRQYPIPIEGKRGLEPVIRELLADGLIEPCMSPYNTPILPVKKSDGTYRLVQDLRAINKIVQVRHPVVP